MPNLPSIGSLLPLMIGALPPYGRAPAEPCGANQVDVLRKRARPRRDNALIPTRRRRTDLRGRRRDLGASIKEMAAGLGMSVADILDIEKGVAMDSRVTHCAAWLTRMETWSAGKREHALQAANRQGRKFNP